MAERSLIGRIKNWLVGRPIPSHLAAHERYSRATGLAVLSSDALSSVAYATEEILRTLMIAGSASLWLVTPIGAVITGLLIVIALSYRQTIYAYPQGGGAYRVARENIGTNAGLLAAAALLTDYVLTVAVSIAAGVSAIVSAAPALQPYRVELALASITVVALGNFRGVSESGKIFSVPTYFFVACVLCLLGVGFFHVISDGNPLLPIPSGNDVAHPALTYFLILRAFANGCTALTGVEALSDGVPAFRPPEAKNAATTLLIMAGLAVTMFMGITVLASHYQISPHENETVVSQLARAVFGGRNIFYFATQSATTLILILAANTAYSDFPRLASILARDRFMPRQFTNQGDRLAFSNGILVLSLAAAVLIMVFRGDTHALIPLYMLGVFISFTLSQTGMVRKRYRAKDPGWIASCLINGVGALLTGFVLIVVSITKFTEGAWIIIAWLPIQVTVLKVIHAHYEAVGKQLALNDWKPPIRNHHTVIVPVGGLHRAVIEAITYATSLSQDVRAVFVDVDSYQTELARKAWEKYHPTVPLIILASPYRSVVEPLLAYVDEVVKERPDDFLTVVLPEFVPAKWWHHLLHNQRAFLVKWSLLFKRNVVVTSVPFHLQQ